MFEATKVTFVWCQVWNCFINTQGYMRLHYVPKSYTPTDSWHESVIAVLSIFNCLNIDFVPKICQSLIQDHCNALCSINQEKKHYILLSLYSVYKDVKNAIKLNKVNAWKNHKSYNGASSSNLILPKVTLVASNINSAQTIQPIWMKIAHVVVNYIISILQKFHLNLLAINTKKVTLKTCARTYAQECIYIYHWPRSEGSDTKSFPYVK